MAKLLTTLAAVGLLLSGSSAARAAVTVPGAQVKTSVSKPVVLKPLSAADRAKVESLLKSFDPKSYDFRYQYTDASGKVGMAQSGKAVGLANLKQSNTVRGMGGAAASTVNTINIFRQASTVNTINIFKQANISNLIFAGTADQQMKAQQINAILAKYLVQQ